MPLMLLLHCCYFYSDRYVQRTTQTAVRKEFLAENQMPVDELSSKNVFK